MVVPPTVIVVGASAGGVEALRQLVSALPADLAAAVLVVLHLPRSSPSALPSILTRSGRLPARAAGDGDELRPGVVYVAPADHHMLVLDHRIRLSRGPTENGHRPAIDPLFRSAARSFRNRVIGVVLSGARDDGAAGLVSIRDMGGRCVVQDPADALHPFMPRAALDRVAVDVVAPASALGAALAYLVSAAPDAAVPARATGLTDAEVAMADLSDLTTEDLPVHPAGYGCPSCGGSLFEVTDEPLPRYRCRVGHAWSPESLLDEHAVALEGALWMALRALEEKAALSRRMARTRAAHGAEASIARFTGTADEAEHAAALIRDLIQRIGSAAHADASAGAPALSPISRE